MRSQYRSGQAVVSVAKTSRNKGGSQAKKPGGTPSRSVILASSRIRKDVGRRLRINASDENSYLQIAESLPATQLESLPLLSILHIPFAHNERPKYHYPDKHPTFQTSQSITSCASATTTIIQHDNQVRSKHCHASVLLTTSAM